MSDAHVDPDLDAMLEVEEDGRDLVGRPRRFLRGGVFVNLFTSVVVGHRGARAFGLEAATRTSGRA